MSPGNALFIGIVVFCVVYYFFRELIRQKRQSIRDEVAEEVLKDIKLDNIKSEILNVNKSFRPGIKKCPACEGVLVIRTGPFGEFLGCSNFPNCKYKES